jgi:hypothetical protein
MNEAKVISLELVLMPTEAFVVAVRSSKESVLGSPSVHKRFEKEDRTRRRKANQR